MIEEKYVLKLFMESDSKKKKIRVICGVHWVSPLPGKVRPAGL